LIEKPLHHFTAFARAPIWNVLPVPGQSWVVIEERDETARKVSFSAIDYEQKRVVWRNDTLAETWWINLVAVTRSQVLLKIFENTTNPDLTHWLALSVNEGKQQEKHLEEDQHTNDLIPPFQYLAGEHDFETVSKFLKTRTHNVPILGADYLEYKAFVFISFYFGAPAAFTNQLACFSTTGELLWQDIIGTNLKGIGVNTFFVVSDYLFFVKNRSELVTFRIV